MRAQGVDGLRPLANQQIARAVEHQGGLLLHGLDGNEAHVRPCHRFADCSRIGRIGRIVLPSPDVGFDVARRHQLHGVTELANLACPVMRGRAGFHTDETGGQLGEERNHLAATKLTRDDDLAARINAVCLKDVLGEIQPDCGNLHRDGPLSDAFQRSPYGTSMPGAGAVHLIKIVRRSGGRVVCRLTPRSPAWRTQRLDRQSAVAPSCLLLG